MKKIINIGLIGCGFISQKHIWAIKNTPGLKLVAVCDQEPKRFEKIVKEQSCIGYQRLQNILDDKNIDLISICTPSGFHPKMIMQAARAKKHIVCEKPLGLDYFLAKKALGVCQQNKVKVFVVMQNRFNPLVTKLKKTLEEKKLGKLVTIDIRVYWQRPQSYYDQDLWRGTKKYDGGILLNQASHHLDLLFYLGGEVSSVFCLDAKRTHQIEVEDISHVLFKFKDGKLGSLTATTCAWSKNYCDSLTIIGQKGLIDIKSVSNSQVNQWQVFGNKLNTRQLAKEVGKTKKMPAYGHWQFYQQVNRILNGGKEIGISGLQALKSLELARAALSSARLKMPISLPLKKKYF